jgi:hypothetical protein
VLKDNKMAAPQIIAYKKIQTEPRSLTTKLLKIHYFFQTKALRGAKWLISVNILRKQQNDRAKLQESCD